MLTEKEKIKLAQAPKLLYPQMMPCLNCGHMWMTHMGKLCPKKGTGLNTIWQPGDTEFLPDEDFYKAPDFEVV